MEKLDLSVEELDERIAPAILTVTPPSGPTGKLNAAHEVNDHAVAADGANGVSVE